MTSLGQRFLVCRTDALGDALLALPVCTALKQSFPQAQVDLLVSEYTFDLLNGQPGPDAVLSLLAPKQNRAFQALLKNSYDVALLVFPDLRVSWAVLRAGIRVRVGTSRRWWSWLYNRRVPHSRRQAQRHEADYNLDLVRALGVEAKLDPPRLQVDSQAQSWADAFLIQRGVQAEDRLIVLHPGGRGSSANWPPQAYGRMLAALPHDASVKVLLTGTMSEQNLLDRVTQPANRPVLRLDQAASLKQFLALIARASVFISGNTGPMHMAAGLGVPQVALFPFQGVTGPVRWRPLNPRAKIITPSGGDRAGRILDEAGLPPVVVAEHVWRVLDREGKK